VTPDLDIDDGERDRDAELAVQHLVEEAVARIVVFARVAAEAELFKQVAVERDDGLDGRDVPAQPRLERRRDPVHARLIRGNVEPGVLVRRDQQRRLHQVDIGLGPGGDFLPALFS
jgi:hypothetical protein